MNRLMNTNKDKGKSKEWAIYMIAEHGNKKKKKWKVASSVGILIEEEEFFAYSFL